MRRDKNDIQWIEVKKRVTKRDRKRCRFIKICTVKEMIFMEKKAPRVLLTRLDHAHIFPVSLYPEIMYKDDNIVLLNRWSHHNLDDCKHPATGDKISKEERDEIWKRIVGETIFNKLLSIIQGVENGREEGSDEGSLS
jgi:hypothetical protein